MRYRCRVLHRAPFCSTLGGRTLNCGLTWQRGRRLCVHGFQGQGAGVGGHQLHSAQGVGGGHVLQMLIRGVGCTHCVSALLFVGQILHCARNKGDYQRRRRMYEQAGLPFDHMITSCSHHQFQYLPQGAALTTMGATILVHGSGHVSQLNRQGA